VSTLADICMDQEQRRHPRYLCVDGGVVRLSVRPEFRGRRAILMDISVGGIGFITEDPLDSGTTLVFDLHGANTEATNRVARVRHARPHPTPVEAPWAPKPAPISNLFRSLFGSKPVPAKTHSWLIGCAFDKPLTEDELKEMIQALESQSIQLP
jgi:hypothetical protein